MAKKKTTRKPVKRKTTSRKAKQVPILSPEQKHMIGAIVCSALTLLLLFAVANFGGSLPTAMFHYLRLMFGYTAYFLPAVTLTLAIMLFRRDNPPRGHNYTGFIVLVLSMSALFHVGINAAQAANEAGQGNGGGFLGFLVANAMLNVLNVAAASVVLLTVIIISVILATNVDLGEMMHGIFSLFRRDGEPKPVAAQALKVNDPTADLLKVNDNSGASTLPVRGQLDLSAKKPVKEKDEPQEALTAGADDAWVPPSMDLLQLASSKADAGDVKANAAIIKSTMESFNIGVTMDEVNVGPTVTQYTFIPPAGVKLNKITTLDTNLALSLAAHPIRIEAPIPGKSAVGVEVPNKTIAMVRLRGVLDSPEWKAEKAPLTFALGRDVSGIPMNADLAKMPHMLIAGATGSGKSAMINSFLTSLLYRNSPNDLKLILVDPKRVELGLYNDIPHLLTPVIVEPEKCISALKWAVAEMERRYKLLAEVGNRNIIEYNKAHPEEAMPYIVIVIDEMADLMVLAAADVESLIVRLAQMARAIGIHLVLATQRPSVDVITGIIKANIPARLAFSVASQVDSRTILDQMGAEKLLGKGDMLFSSPDFMKPRRIQGAFLDEKEVKGVTDYLRSLRAPNYNDEVLAMKVTIGGKSGGGGGGGSNGEIDDDLFEEAAEAVIRAGKASTSMLQRRLRVGYARAARLIDLLEEQGVVGPADGARPRDVLVSSLDQVRGGGSGVAGVEEMRQAEPYDGE